MKQPPIFDYLIAVTGASGSVYAQRLIEELLKRQYRLGLIFSQTGQEVFAYELNLPADFNLQAMYPTAPITVYNNHDLFAPPASGSRVSGAMIVIPASMGTVSRIAQGNAASLIERAADVYLKENRPLILVPRESPLNAIHLENMLKLSRLGVRLIAAMPGFYHHPQKMEDLIDFIVGKVLEALNLDHNLYPTWEA